MRAWDRLDPFRHRGAGGHVVSIRFPRSPIWSHMSVFPARTYKKAHRHGPGILIVIPSGEGFSVGIASAWEQAAIRSAYNASSIAADESDATMLDGQPLSEWISTVNMQPDLTLENHGFFNQQLNQ